MPIFFSLTRSSLRRIVFILLIIGFTASCGDDGEVVVLLPADLIIVVDNSSDMTNAVEGLQDNLYSELAQLLEDAGLDFRIVLIGEYGMLSDASVCIEAPLSGINDCSLLPNQPVNTSRFYHYSTEISSNDALCSILETLEAADEFNIFPNGWIELLRTDAVKFFMVLTNDGVDCFSGLPYNDLNTALGGNTVADQFNNALTGLAPAQFGTSSQPGYRFISIVGNPDKDGGNPAVAYTASDPITTSECGTAASPGTGYQGVSNKTEGSRYSVCQPGNFDVIFNAAAQNIIDAATE